MTKNIKIRLLIIAVVIGACIYGFTPPKDKVKLGLDLKGGVHLVLRVRTDDAVKLQTDLMAERLRDELNKANLRVAKLEAVDMTTFRVQGAQDPDAVKAKAETVVPDSDFTRSTGVGGDMTFTLRPNIINKLRQDAVEQARQTIDRRVNELGVSEPTISIQGADELLVQLPGVTDVERVKDIIGKTAVLQLKLVDNGPFSSQESALQAYNNNLPSDIEIMPGKADGDTSSAGAANVFYAVRKTAVVAGSDLRSAQPSLDQYSRPAVHFTLKQDAATRFGTVSEANIGRRLAIILDNTVLSAPTLNSRITDSGEITGVSQIEAQNLVITLKSGALPARLDYRQQQTIGPSLGADSIRSGVIASVVGLVLIVIFMLIYYKLSGVNAVVALVFNLIILLGLMSYIGAVMTLPGIAGFVLTMGIGVDSNVLIFERIKEELEAGRGVRPSINAGFGRVFLTLLDTHISAVVGALFLFGFGTGPIRGFAYTLLLGLGSNLFTSTFVSKTMFELALSRRRQAATLSI
jgi:preprotein translocase subunit SecD